MESSRWWHVAVLGTGAVLTAVLFLDGTTGWRLAGGLAAVAALVLAWFLAGRLAWRTEQVKVPFVIAVILIIGVACSFDSALATFQCIGFPLIWTMIDRVRSAIIANVVLAVSAGVGTWFSGGRTIDALAVAIVIEVISLSFSLALGFWITSIADRSDERRRLIVDLEAAQSKVAALGRDAGAAGERERLAREIHDTIAQDLTGLVLTAQRGLRELRDGNAGGAETQLIVLEENARNALAETRALVASGAAVGVEVGGLAVALRRLGERFERETGIRVTVEADDHAPLDRDGEVVLLRCAQEALANVRKHSAATTSTLILVVDDKDATVTITDDGTGFDVTRPPSGFGLEGMRERLAFVRGSLALDSSAGGTTLVARLPRDTGVTA
jgi:signal transduction histidine kinase